MVEGRFAGATTAERNVGESAVGVGLKHPCRVDGTCEELLEGFGSQIGRAVAAEALIDEQAQPEASAAGLAGFFNLAVPSGEGGMAALRDADRDFLGTQLLGMLDDARCEVEKVRACVHRPPPTLSLPTLTVGMPWLTGTP